MNPSEHDLVRFVYREARLLDEKRFDEWYELFTEDGFYWVPLAPDQVDPLDHTSLAYEDRLLLKLRIERLKSPRAFSQQPPSRCHHLLQMPEVEKSDPAGNEHVRSHAVPLHRVAASTSSTRTRARRSTRSRSKAAH